MYQKERKKITWRIAVICCLALLLAGCDHQAGFYVEQQEEAEAGQEAGSQDSGNAGDSREADSQGGGNAEMIYVQVSGAVAAPGVYQLPEGSRVFEAVELAGGMTEEADMNSLNQAQVLSDGQMIYLYAVGEQQAVGSSETAQKDDRLDINTATAEELMALPGIGQSKAESIIAFREEHGAFEKTEDIMNIEGIKEGVFSKLKDRIKVN